MLDDSDRDEMLQIALAESAEMSQAQPIINIPVDTDTTMQGGGGGGGVGVKKRRTASNSRMHSGSQFKAPSVASKSVPEQQLKA